MSAPTDIHYLTAHESFRFYLQLCSLCFNEKHIHKFLGRTEISAISEIFLNGKEVRYWQKSLLESLRLNPQRFCHRIKQTLGRCPLRGGRKGETLLKELEQEMWRGHAGFFCFSDSWWETPLAVESSCIILDMRACTLPPWTVDGRDISCCNDL